MPCHRSFQLVDGTKDPDPHVRVSIEPNPQLDIVYQMRDGHVDMEPIIWAQTTDVTQIAAIALRSATRWAVRGRHSVRPTA